MPAKVRDGQAIDAPDDLDTLKSTRRYDPGSKVSAGTGSPRPSIAALHCWQVLGGGHDGRSWRSAGHPGAVAFFSEFLCTQKSAWRQCLGPLLLSSLHAPLPQASARRRPVRLPHPVLVACNAAPSRSSLPCTTVSPEASRTMWSAAVGAHRTAGTAVLSPACARFRCHARVDPRRSVALLRHPGGWQGVTSRQAG